jgi:diadenosine tetraphosphatase ApaH/serine/threonine PP2A family protein phosphatase
MEEAPLQIALLSDIHGNAHALDACLRHAAGRGAGQYAFLGDFVGYGGEPAAVLDVLAEYAARGAVVLKGNHDEAIDKYGSYFNDAAQAALELAREQLSAEHKTFLAGLPLITRAGSICYAHASAATPEKWPYIDSPGAAQRCAEASQAAWTFCGHVHDQVLYFQGSGGRMNEFRPVPGTPIPVREGRRWVALVGSVGQPRDRSPAAAYAMFDSTLQRLTFFRVPYDAAGAAEKIRQSGLPASLAYRVEMGI